MESCIREAGYGIGYVYLSVAEDVALRKYRWTPAQFRELVQRSRSVEQVEAEMPGARKAIEDCVEVIASVLRSKMLMQGEFSYRHVVEPFLYDAKPTLIRELCDFGRLGEFRKRFNMLSDKEPCKFKIAVRNLAKKKGKEEDDGGNNIIMSAFYAILVAVADANAVQ